MAGLESLNWLVDLSTKLLVIQNMAVSHDKYLVYVIHKSANQSAKSKTTTLVTRNGKATWYDDGDDFVLGGGNVVKGMKPYAQRYGGHQFGNWAHQLGDGRAITLGEVQLPDEVLELQLGCWNHSLLSICRW